MTAKRVQKRVDDNFEIKQNLLQEFWRFLRFNNTSSKKIHKNEGNRRKISRFLFLDLKSSDFQTCCLNIFNMKFHKNYTQQLFKKNFKTEPFLNFF